MFFVMLGDNPVMIYMTGWGGYTPNITKGHRTVDFLVLYSYKILYTYDKFICSIRIHL